MLRRAAEKATAAGVRVTLARANLADLSALRDGSFDHAACLFSTLGMIVGAGPRRQAVAQAFRVLRPGGRFLLHVHNRLFHLGSGLGRRWLAGNTLAALTGRGKAGDREMPGPAGVGRLTLHLFTRGEAVRLLRQAGFRVDQVVPVGVGADGTLPAAWLLPAWRAYGFFLAARRPG
jgi:SAM-dependent methyltransferase